MPNINTYFRDTGIGSSGGRMKISESGEISFVDDAAGWNDITSTFLPSSVNPSTTPDFAAFGANGLYALKFAEGDIAFINFHIKHDILIGSSIYPHVHFSPATTMSVGETIVWTIDYVSADRSSGDSLTETLTQATLTYTADGTEVAGEHLVVEVADIDAFVTGDVDSIILMMCTLGNGTYTGDVFGHMADLHYQVARLSTPNKESPFV